MSVTKDLLKKESANFDVECIFQLNLENKGKKKYEFKCFLYFYNLFALDITNLGSLSECINLEILNLALNDISCLLPLKTLVNLQYLNLSCNRISNLGKCKSYSQKEMKSNFIFYKDGLQTIEKLRSLNLAGNLINRYIFFFSRGCNEIKLRLMFI